MALASTTIWEVQYGGSDSICGGAFDPVTGTRPTDLAGTNATTASPVVTSASYTFVSGDIGSWLYIKSGTNWTPGWYQIASVSAGAATLTASIGSVFLLSFNEPSDVNLVVGCATTASPTSGTWSIDYSQQSSAQFTLTGLSGSSTTVILLSTATKAMVGNIIQITGGTSFTTGFYLITAAAAGTSITVDRACNTSGTAGTAVIGGAVASVGKAIVSQGLACVIFQKYNASPFLITSASTNISGGCWAPTARTHIYGYDTKRHNINTDVNMPTNQASSISTAVIVAAAHVIKNITIDGNSLTSIRGFNSNLQAFNCVALNCTNGGFVAVNTTHTQCLAIGCSTGVAFNACQAINCAAINCSAGGFTTCSTICCYAIGCSTGFLIALPNTISCTAYGCSGDGFIFNTTDTDTIHNCISYGNTGKGFNLNAKLGTGLYNCAAGGNTGTDADTMQYMSNIIILTANPFVNPSATINKITDCFAAFALNNTPGGGQMCRRTGAFGFNEIGAYDAPSNMIKLTMSGGFG
jgi:hypothetical protein